MFHLSYIREVHLEVWRCGLLVIRGRGKNEEESVGR